jgi:hypothetical protein
MNEWYRPLAAPDHVYGFSDKTQSTVRNVSKIFDERTNEHVIMLEYRVCRGGGFGHLPRARTINCDSDVPAFRA